MFRLAARFAVAASGASPIGMLLVGMLVIGAQSTPAVAGGPVVVELFTSQGCSSCPPADAYLGELALRRDVVPLAFHVDYWNYIGWSDPFASKQMTERQKDYQRALNQRYVYTPEMVINGAAHEVGSDRHQVEKLIEAAEKAPQDGPQVKLALGDDGKIRAHIGAGAAGETATVWLIKYDRPHETAVGQGENAGRKLTDYQVVRTMRELAQWKGTPLDLEYEAKEADEPGDGGCAVLVQRDGAGPIIAAAMLTFPPGS
jgi:hypothetical protein